MPNQPIYDVGDEVFLISSAQIGNLESYLVTNLSWSQQKGAWQYIIEIKSKGPAPLITLGDRITHRHDKKLIFDESELITFCEAAELVKTNIERRILSLDSQLSDLCEEDSSSASSSQGSSDPENGTTDSDVGISDPGTSEEPLVGTSEEALGTSEEALGTSEEELLGTSEEELLGTSEEELLGTSEEELLGTSEEGLQVEMFALALNANDEQVDTSVDLAVPFARRQNVSDIEEYQILDENDNPLPTQWKVTSRWHSTRDDDLAPIKLAVASVTAGMPSASGDRTGSTGSTPLKIVKLDPADTRSRGSIDVTDNGSSFTINNGDVQAVIPKNEFKPFTSLTVDGDSIISSGAGAGFRVRFQDLEDIVSSQTTFTTVTNITTTVVDQDSLGSTKVRIRQRGDVGSTSSLRYEAWWTFRQGTEEIEFEFFLINEHAYGTKTNELQMRGRETQTRRAVEHAWVDFDLDGIQSLRNQQGTDFDLSSSTYRILQGWRQGQGLNTTSTPWGQDYGTELTLGSPDSALRTMRHLLFYKEGVGGTYTTNEATVDPSRGDGSGKLLPPWGQYDGVWDIETSNGHIGLGYEYFWQKSPSRVDVDNSTLSVALFPEALPGESEHQRGWEHRGEFSTPKLAVSAIPIADARPSGNNPVTGAPYEVGNSLPLDFPSSDNQPAGESFPVPPAALGGDPAFWGRVRAVDEGDLEAGKRYYAEESNLGGLGNAIGDIIEVSTNGAYAGSTVIDINTGATTSNYIVNRQEIGLDGNSPWVIGYSMLWDGGAWVQNANSADGMYEFQVSGRLFNGDDASQYAWSVDDFAPEWDVTSEFRNKYQVDGGRKFGMRLWLKPRGSTSNTLTTNELDLFQRRVEFPPAAAVDPTEVRERDMLDPLPFIERKPTGDDFDIDRFEKWLDLMVDDEVSDPINSGGIDYKVGWPRLQEIGGRITSYFQRTFGWDHFGDNWGLDNWTNNSYDTSLRFAEGFLRTRDIRYYHQGRFRAEWTINAGIIKEDIVGGLSEGWLCGGHVYEKGDPSGSNFVPGNGHWWVEGALAWCRLTGNEQYIQDTRYTVDWVLNDADNRRPGAWGGEFGHRVWGWPMVGLSALYAFYGPLAHQGPHPTLGAKYKSPTHTLLDEMTDGIQRYDDLQSGAYTINFNGFTDIPVNFMPPWYYEIAPAGSQNYAPIDTGNQNSEVDDVTINVTTPTYTMTGNTSWQGQTYTSGSEITGRDYSNNGIVLQRSYNPRYIAQIWMVAIAYAGFRNAVRSHPEFGGNYVNTSEPILVTAMDNMAKMRDFIRYSSQNRTHPPAFSDPEDDFLPQVGYIWSFFDRQQEQTLPSSSVTRSIIEGAMVHTVCPVYCDSHYLFAGSVHDRSSRQDNDLNLSKMWFRTALRYFQQRADRDLPRTTDAPTNPAVYDQVTGEPVGLSSDGEPASGELFPVNLTWFNSGQGGINRSLNNSMYRWGLHHLWGVGQ